MRDHTKLEAFQLADKLAVNVYRATRTFPREETFGLSGQLRRAAVSVAANIVEGAARVTEGDYVRQLSIAYSSVKEVQYEISLATRLGYLEGKAASELARLSSRTARALWSLIRALRGAGPTVARRP